ncbi:MAG TPA: HAMP domain-containing protein, partial [Candidatus Eisenbacteria bacterium]
MEPRSEAPAPAISLGVRVAVFTSLSVLTAVLVSALVLEISGRAEARSAADEQLRRARNVASERLSRDGEGLRRLAATVARDPKFFALLALRRSERTATFRRSLEGVIREFQSDADVEIFDVTDEWGATAAASQRPSAPEASRGSSPLVRRALAGEGALGFRLEGGRLYRVAVVPVLAGGTAPVGTLTLGVPLDDSFAESVRSGTGADFLLLAGETPAPGGKRPTARSIVTTLSDAGARSVLQTIGPAPRAETRGRLRKGQPVSLAKAPALAADVPLDGATEGGSARLLLVAPLALETGLASLRETLLAAGAVAAAMSLLVGFIVGRRMSRRLRRLRMAAREARAGNYEAPLPEALGDEVGLLTADFQAMREMQRQEIDRLVEIDRMKTDFLAVTAQDLMAPVEEIRKAGDTMAARNAPALGPDGLRRLRVIRGGAATLKRMVDDLGGASVVLSQESEPEQPGQDAEEEEKPSIEVVAS